MNCVKSPSVLLQLVPSAWLTV